jgi:hypothetical protein
MPRDVGAAADGPSTSTLAGPFFRRPCLTRGIDRAHEADGNPIGVFDNRVTRPPKCVERWLKTFDPPFAISTSRRTAGNGLPISTPMFFAPNATSRSGDRSNDVAWLCPNPADDQRRLNHPSDGCASLSTSSSHGSCFLRTAVRGAEPGKIAQIPAIGIKRVLLRRTDVSRNEVRSALQSDDRRRLEPISKLFEEDNEAGKLDKAKEIVGVVLPANEDPALPLNPGEETLDEPASHVAA